MIRPPWWWVVALLAATPVVTVVVTVGGVGLLLVRTNRVDVLTVVELTTDEVARLRGAGLDRLLPHHELDPGDLRHGCRRLEPSPSLGGSGAARDDLAHRGGARRRTVPEVLSCACRPSGLAVTASWARDLATLDGWMTRQGDALVVGGDFNSSTDAPQLREMLHGGLADAAGQAHAG